MYTENESRGSINMNILDIVIVLFLISCIVMGWKNGVIKETVSFVGIVLVLISLFLAYYLVFIILF